MKKKLTFLITAGPTQEPLDPVRFLTNHSSGKMGYALAQAATKLGHHVILVSGPVNLKEPKVDKLIKIQTAREMYTQVMKHFNTADIIIKVAAVSDYRPAHKSKKKIKKTDEDLTLKLIRNPDILLNCGKKKKETSISRGFCGGNQ